MSQEYIKLIAETDRNLALFRESWMEAPLEKKSRWMEVINKALDERLQIMAKRDSKAVSV